MLSLDLKKSNANETVQGKLILNITTNVNVPVRNGTNNLAPGRLYSQQQPNASHTSVVTETQAASSNEPAAASTAASSSSSAAAARGSHQQHDNNDDLPPG